MAYEKIDQYIKERKFRKKIFGGCDEEDVLHAIKDICSMYQDMCEQQVAGQTESVRRQLEAANVNRAELEKKLAQANVDVQFLRRQLEESENKTKEANVQRLAVDRQFEAEKKRSSELYIQMENARKRADILQKQLTEEQEQSKNRGTELLSQYREFEREQEEKREQESRLLDDARRRAEDIVYVAHKEADQIRERARIAAGTELRELRQQKEQAERRIQMTMDEASPVLATVKTDVIAILDRITHAEESLAGLDKKNDRSSDRIKELIR